jgi:hypothetical protein
VSIGSQRLNSLNKHTDRSVGIAAKLAGETTFTIEPAGLTREALYVAAVAPDAGETVQSQLDKYPTPIFGQRQDGRGVIVTQDHCALDGISLELYRGEMVKSHLWSSQKTGSASDAIGLPVTEATDSLREGQRQETHGDWMEVLRVHLFRFCKPSSRSYRASGAIGSLSKSGTSIG